MAQNQWAWLWIVVFLEWRILLIQFLTFYVVELDLEEGKNRIFLTEDHLTTDDVFSALQFDAPQEAKEYVQGVLNAHYFVREVSLVAEIK